MRGDRPYTRVKGTGWERDERRVEDGKGGEGESERERERDEYRIHRSREGEGVEGRSILSFLPAFHFELK